MMDTLPIALPSWLPKGAASLALALSLLAGCAEVEPKPEPAPPTEERHDDPYGRSDLDELLDFGAGLGGKTAAERGEVCRALLSRQKEAPGTGVQLHLLTGRLLSDACGDAHTILEGVDAIPLDNLLDERVRRWVSVQKETLKRMHGLSKKLVVLERKQKSLQSLLGSKDIKSPSKRKGAKASKDGDARLLREKLEAIRDMEKKLDEAGDGN